ncbi:GDP-mannose 4,6-dehydratase [Gryllotalpicola reticulitermitis]|uniref:GDP-mannose 4,6-dehydratase n=1 Tax=Gryllotalpicola reticulitermitis TaxID=1184153 RepID=A0ABV8Q7B9_9MICO
MSTAFVTGATGQTGSYLVENLVHRGWQVHALAREGDRPASLVGLGVEFHTGDLMDSSRIGPILTDVSPSVIINLAALSSVAASWREPMLTAEINGLAVAALLDGAYQLQQQRGEPVSFVQASSAEIFGDALMNPQNELTPIAPVNPYGASKAYAHLLAGAYRKAGLSASSVILYNHESPRRPEQFVTRKITLAAARIKAGLQSSVTLGDLTIRRDWGWAPDYADAIARIATGDVAGDFVVATGESHTIEDFVRAAFDSAGIADWRSHVDTDPALQRPADAADLRGDASKIRETYGWGPTVGFNEIVRRMVEADVAALRPRASPPNRGT